MPWIIIPIVLIVLVIIVYKKQKHALQNQRKSLDELREDLDKFASIYLENMDTNDHYITHDVVERIREDYDPLHIKVKKLHKSLLKMDQLKSFIERYEHLESDTTSKNRAYVNAEIERCCSIFDNIDGKSMDRQQREAVVIQENNQLVLAGAGSGKTLTISAKVKYLVDELKYKPEDVLLISFTKNSAEEMEQRIQGKLGIPVEVKTFHKMGLDIIKKYEGLRPDVAGDDFFKTAIDEFFTSFVLKSHDLVYSIIEFFACYMNLPKNHEEFDSTDEFMSSIMGEQYGTLRGSLKKVKQDLEENNITLYGEYVKSHEELMIANFLFLNGIKYEYERLYPYKSDDPYRKQYRPDFYLPEHDLYLEHFGVDANGNAPYLSKIEEQKYQDGMAWKRKMSTTYRNGSSAKSIINNPVFSIDITAVNF